MQAVYHIFQVEQAAGFHDFISCSFNVTENYVLATIKTLDPNKFQGGNNISIKLINICSQSLILPLKIIFEQSLKGKFQKKWKKANIVLVHKKKTIAQLSPIIHETQTALMKIPLLM